MPSNEFYFLVMACGAFAVFSLVLIVNHIQHRRWHKLAVRRR
jgi:hypothetical protein